MMKTCTHCNETVRADARKCQFCSFRFDVAPTTWPARAAMFGAVAIAGAIVMAVVVTPWLAIPELAVALVMFAGAAIGSRANTRRMFRDSGAVPALRPAAPASARCCPACTPA